MTDTPETDTPESDKAKIAFTSLFASDDAYWVPFIVARKMERERDQWRNEHDRVVREFQHRLTVIGISVIDATSYPENVDVEARDES